MERGQASWRYYNHALIPAGAPHEKAKLSELASSEIWNQNGENALFATWVTDFDCEKETDWWYCVKDTTLDLDRLKAKHRYEIRKGQRNFEVCRIDPEEQQEAMYRVLALAQEGYSGKGIPQVNQATFQEFFPGLDSKKVYGAFDRETGKLCGFAWLAVQSEYADFQVMRTIPAEEQRGVNAALVARICEEFRESLKDGFYISDGSRNIQHDTHFQDYLEKYFGFRKAYCRLHLRFRRPLGMAVTLLYPFRNLIKKGAKNPWFRKIWGVLLMQEICLNQQGGLYPVCIKRLFDIMISLAVLVILSPLVALLALIVLCDLGCPVIFRQIRPGKDGKLFTMYKFRTMREEKDSASDCLSDEARLSKIGRILRESSLDELPQLVNILRGDMSLVGPRPQLVRDMVFMTKDQNRRHLARPGITGLAQVNGRNAITWEAKLGYDQEYVKNISFRYDVRILLQTIRVVLRREGISAEGRETSEDLGDYLLRSGMVTEEEYREKQQEAIHLLKEYK